MLVASLRAMNIPLKKTPQKKLNPLQQITYFGLLNVLLPLQIITGVVIWGMQTWPQFVQSLGGLPVLAPIHTLIAWLLASFIIMHMYLTTTGHKPLGSVQAMIDGWDEVEVMFTGILVAMVLIFAAAGLGLVDYNRIFVNPTYLWPGVVGGLIMGLDLSSAASDPAPLW